MVVGSVIVVVRKVVVVVVRIAIAVVTVVGVVGMWKVEYGSVSTTEFPVHNAKVRFVSSSKDKGTSIGRYVNETSPHGSPGTMNGEGTFGFGEFFHRENGISRGEGGPLAKDPTVRIQTEHGRLVTGRGHPRFAHPYRRIAPFTPYVPRTGETGPGGMQSGRFAIVVRNPCQQSRVGSAHGIVHPSTDIVRLGTAGTAVSNRRCFAVQSPVGRRWLRFALVLIFGRGKLETDAMEAPSVYFTGTRELNTPP